MQLSRFFLAGLLVLPAFSQQQTPKDDSTPPPVLKVTTRLVQVSVVVHDHHGTPLAGLTKENFTLTDQGKPQTISLFSVETIGGEKQAVNAGVIMPRNQFSNRVDRQSHTPTSVTVVLLDIGNTKFADRAYAQQQIVKFLRQVRPDDRIALYSMNGGGFRVIHDFTNNASALLASLAKFVPGLGKDLTPSEIASADEDSAGGLDSFIGSGDNAVGRFFQRNRILDTCTALTVLANHLEGITGRKNLVWVSAGFPITLGFGDPGDHFGPNLGRYSQQDQEIFADQIEATARAMNTANIAVYPVDARGLMGLPMADASKNWKPGKNGQLPPAATHVDTKNIDTMNYMADLTGGKAFYNSNDIQGAIRKAIDDSAVTYTLGYYASEENWDNKYHKIKVKVNESGASVRSQKGYFARELAPPTKKQLDEATRDTIWSPLDATGIGVQAVIDPSPTVAYGSRITMKVAPSDVHFEDVGDRKVGAIDVLFVQRTKRGQQLANELQTLQMKLTKETYDHMVQNGISAGRDLKIGPQTEAVRIVVVDRSTGEVGSVTVPVTSLDKSGANVAGVPAPVRPAAPKADPFGKPDIPPQE